MVAILLADSEREAISAYSPGLWASPPLTPIESMQGIPKVVTSEASDPPGLFPASSFESPFFSKSSFALLSRLRFHSLSSIAALKFVWT